MENDNQDDDEAWHPTAADESWDGEYLKTLAILVDVATQREIYREQWTLKHCTPFGLFTTEIFTISSAMAAIAWRLLYPVDAL
jgi:hypothetical protein